MEGTVPKGLKSRQQVLSVACAWDGSSWGPLLEPFCSTDTQVTRGLEGYSGVCVRVQ